MIYPMIVGELAVIAAICGLVAGSVHDRAKLTRNFLWLVLIGVVMALVLIAVTHYQSDWISDLIRPWLDKYQYYREKSIFAVWWIGPLWGNISGEVLWSVTALAVWLVWAAGLIAFNCRCAVKSWWAAPLGVAAGAAIVYYLWFWGYAGLGSLMVFGGSLREMISLESVSVAAVIANTLLLAAWTWYSFCGKRRGWRVLVSQLAIWAGCYLLCWGGAYLLSATYACYVKCQAEKQGVVAYRVINNPSLPEIAGEIQKISHFQIQHQSFWLPLDCIYAWRKKRYDQQAMVTDKVREYTLKFFDSPEMTEYYQYYDNILNAEIPPDTLDCGQMVYLRCRARVCAGRAALYFEKGEPDKILPMLLKIIAMDPQKLTVTPYIFAEYSRLDCCSVLCSNLVSLGPDGPQYAPYYRQALDYLKEQKVCLPDDAGGYLDQLERLKPGNYFEFLAWPGALAFSAKRLAYFMSIRPEIQKLEADGYHGEALPWDYLDIYKRLASSSEFILLLGRTGVALKLYRSEEGKYPATLAGLVPKYLDKTPESPFPGHPLVYESDGKDFTLTLIGPGDKKNVISSQKDY